MKLLIAFILNFISCLVFAQEGWTAKDSIKLSKMLDGENPIYINDDFRNELEQSLTSYPIKRSSSKLNDFILGVKPKSDLMEYPKMNKVNLRIQYNTLKESLFIPKYEYIKVREFLIRSNTDLKNPYISIERNTNISIPVGKKLYFNIHGNYTLDKKRSVVLPVTSIPYEVGVGFSYNISKHLTIKSQTNYQYNLIQRKWEWFFGAGITFTF